MSYQIFLTKVSIVFCFCTLSSMAIGQEQAIPQAVPPVAQSAPMATTCQNDQCSYYYDAGQNIYVITKACSDSSCYCPIEVIGENGEGGENGGNANQGEAKAAAAYSCASPIQLEENMMRVSLRHEDKQVNLTLKFKDPTKLPNKSVRFQVKANAADPGFKWEIKVTYDPGIFEQHKPYPLGPPTGTKVGESNLYYLGGAFETFGHYDDAASKTRIFEFNKNYKVEITRGN